MKQNQIKWGVVLSYALIVLNTLYGLLITPFVMHHLGIGNYGVYKTISSMSASLAVMDLGLGATMTRYMARYNATGRKQEADNFAGMVFVQYVILAATIGLMGAGAYKCIAPVYGATFSPEELILAQRLFVVLVLNLVLRLFENLLVGIANGYEQFAVANGIKLISIVMKFSLILILLPLFRNPLLIALLETGIVSAMIVVLMGYVIRVIEIRPRLRYWDKGVFRESMGYTVLMFIQTLTIQFNGNIDNILVGAELGATSVAVYSMALAIFGMYESLSGAIANIMLPNMTKRVVEGQSPRELQTGVERAGRYQFVLLAAALGGFTVLGREFFYLWLGLGFEDCYYLTLLLMIPVTFPMMQNVALSILRAENKMVYRTVTLMISCGINAVVTIVGIRTFGYWGAAIGTACATMVNLLLMNIYYHRHLGFHVFQLFRNVMRRIWGCAAIASVATALFHRAWSGTWISFVGNAVFFLAVYGVLLILWGLSKDEKIQLFQGILRRR